MIKSIVGVLVIGCMALLVLLDKKKIKKGLEFISVYWFKLAFSFLVLFILNISAGFFGVYVPVNIVSGLVITVLGIPGFLSILLISIFL